MSKQRPLKFLIIDDKKEYVETLNSRAEKKRIILLYARTLEDGKKTMKTKTGKEISGVILDAICLKDSKQEVPHKSFIPKAIKYFEKSHPELPMAILTGEPDEFTQLKEFYKGELNVYSKGHDEDNMLKFLKESALMLDRNRIINAYPDVFEIIEKHMDIEAEEDLIKCLKDMKNSENTQIKNNLTCLRRLLEKVFKTAYKINPEIVKIVPADYLKSNVKVRKIIGHLKDKHYITENSIIAKFADTIYGIASDFGAHSTQETPDYPPSKYTVQSLTFALLDMILWLEKIKKIKKKEGV